MPLSEYVWGIVLNGEAKAYPLSALKKQNNFEELVGGIKINIIFKPENKMIKAKVASTGEPLKLQIH